MLERAARRKVLRKYILLQIPEMSLFGIVIWGLLHYEEITLATACILVCAWLVKDIVLFPLTRSAYEPGPAHGTDALVGAEGVVTKRIAPQGSVRLGAELWTARAAEGLAEIREGDRIQVMDVEGFTLIVVPIAPPE